MKIRFLPSGHEFAAEKNESVLEAALRSGLSPNYSCDKGSCGKCMARLVSGEVTRSGFHDYKLTEAEKIMGYVLLCRVAPKTDLIIEASEAGSAGDIPLQQVMTRVTRLERLQEEVLILHLRTPRTHTLRFLAGQYVRLDVDDMPPNPLPIASCPCNAMNLQFHVGRNDADPFSHYLFTRIKSGDTVPLQGPFGEFTLDESSSRPIIFIAYGTGFAPVKSVIEHAISMELSQPIHLYRVALHAGGHYLENYCHSWADALDNFRYTALIETGQTGVHDPEPKAAVKRPERNPPVHVGSAAHKVVKDYPDLTGFDIYLCADEATVTAATRAFYSHGLPPDQLHTESLDRL